MDDRLHNATDRLVAAAELLASLDRGDLVGLDGWAVECKDVGRIDLAGWVDEASAEAVNVGGDALPVVVAKRRGRGVEHGYVVVPLWVWVRMLRVVLNK
jgi:hypothetical protein